MRINGDKVALFQGEEKTADEYATYIKILSVKPYLTAREASTFFDVGLSRMKILYTSPKMREYAVQRGRRALLPRDVVRAALIEDCEGGQDD